MAKDFAKQFRVNAKAKDSKSQETNSVRINAHSQKNGRTSRKFHFSSFLTGLAVGITMVLASPYIEKKINEQPANITGKKIDDSRSIIFQFDEKLRTEAIEADTENYLSTHDATNLSRTEHLIQVGAYATETEADTTRASLTLLGFSAFIQYIELERKPWYRVFVGPFPSRLESGRALTKLRENDIEAFVVARKLED
mgnify:CR=1 FL=1|tara:strand:- start:101 stop:691 length:591 start_codon:yes stop_codon:yes gene_type:complete